MENTKNPPTDGGENNVKEIRAKVPERQGPSPEMLEAIQKQAMERAKEAMKQMAEQRTENRIHLVADMAAKIASCFLSPSLDGLTPVQREHVAYESTVLARKILFESNRQEKEYQAAQISALIAAGELPNAKG